MKLYQTIDIDKELLTEISYYLLNSHDYIFVNKDGVIRISPDDMSGNVWMDESFWDGIPTVFVGQGYGQNWLSRQPVEVLPTDTAGNSR
jgi:hypothetical protein